jgi:periplasmic protein TonB
MRSSRWLDRGFAVGLVGSLACHAAALGAIALVRFDVAASPIQVDLVELEAPAPPPTPAPRPSPTKARPAPEPELAAPAPPEPPVVPDRVEPRISVAVAAPILPEQVTAPPVPRRPSEEPPAPTVRRPERTEPVGTAAPSRPERPLAERSEAVALQTVTAETTALPERVERRVGVTGPSPKPLEPVLAVAGSAQAVRPAGQPTVELGRVERTDEPHLTTLLASRTAEPDVPAAPPAPPRELAAAIPTGDRPPTPVIPAPAARPSLPPAPGLQAALPPAPASAGAFVAPRLTAPKRPRYPEAARQAGVEGTVLVKAYILADGSVREALVARSAGNSALDGAALRTIRESRFTPAQRGGRPVPVWVEVPIDFRLER